LKTLRFIKKKIRILHFIKSYSYLCRITSAKDLIDVNYLLALKAPKCTFYAADIVLKELNQLTTHKRPPFCTTYFILIDVQCLI